MDFISGFVLGAAVMAGAFVAAIRRSVSKPEGKTAKFLNTLK